MQNQDERRQRVLAEAAQHFLRDGFERTSLDRIAAGARVSKTVLYAQFQGKDDLFEQVVRAELARPAPAATPVAGGLDATLEAFASQAMAEFYTPRFFGIFRANIVARRRFPALATSVHAFMREASEPLAAYLAARRADGQLDFQGGAIDLANRFGGLAQEGVRPLLGLELLSDAEQAAHAGQMVEMFLHGCRGLDASATAEEPPVPVAAPGARAKMRLKPERFEALCGAALEEFIACGFEASSIERIIAQSGVSRATIYRQFASKEGLFGFVIGREIECVEAERIDPPSEGDPEARLAALARLILDRHLAPRSLALHRLLIEEAPAFPELARAFYRAQAARSGAPFAAALQAAGLPAPAPRTIRMFHTLATHAARYVIAEREPSEADRRALSLETARIVWRGLAG